MKSRPTVLLLLPTLWARAEDGPSGEGMGEIGAIIYVSLFLSTRLHFFIRNVFHGFRWSFSKLEAADGKVKTALTEGKDKS